MTSGSGRGRGWLNLNKNAQNRPGGAPSDALMSNHVDSISQDFSSLNTQMNQYSKLLSLIEQLDQNDDGILLNQKFKSILHCWRQECNDVAEVEDSFKYIYSKCLQDSALATKLVSMVSSPSFITTEIHEVKIRTIFVGHIQMDFENRKQLQKSNPTAFRNSIRMLGQFYHKARLGNGRAMTFLAAPAVQYLEMLLESAEPSDLELFTAQLHLIGSSIKNDCSQKLDEILLHVRRILVKSTNLTPQCRVWMLLALDVVFNRYGLLPTDLQKFYQEQLGDKAMANFQGTYSALSIQTPHPDKSLDGYQSNVSVLQVTPPESTSPDDHSNNSHGHLGDFGSNANEWDAKEKPGKEKGRPILGAGARLQRSRAPDDSNWRKPKENAGWDNKKDQKQWASSAKKSGKHGKGWEHDDRFENDY